MEASELAGRLRPAELPVERERFRIEKRLEKRHDVLALDEFLQVRVVRPGGGAHVELPAEVVGVDDALFYRLVGVEQSLLGHGFEHVPPGRADEVGIVKVPDEQVAVFVESLARLPGTPQEVGALAEFDEMVASHLEFVIPDVGGSHGGTSRSFTKSTPVGRRDSR